MYSTLSLTRFKWKVAFLYSITVYCYFNNWQSSVQNNSLQFLQYLSVYTRGWFWQISNTDRTCGACGRCCLQPLPDFIDGESPSYIRPTVRVLVHVCHCGFLNAAGTCSIFSSFLALIFFFKSSSHLLHSQASLISLSCSVRSPQAVGCPQKMNDVMNWKLWK